jgi:photosystem II stability/assembly factor-like uncharacterized protein
MTNRLFLLVALLSVGFISASWAGSQEPPKPGEERKVPEEPVATEEGPDAPKPGGPPAEFTYLKYRLIGPDVGGRMARAAGVPGDPLTYYAAAAAGGVWKSADGGYTWNSVFEEQPISSIGSLAIAPANPNVVYVGSGEANIRGNVAAGNGIYKTTDGGKTWKHVWKQEGQIGTMIVHPTNPDIAFAAVLGHAFGPNPERGVYRTRDGGKTWDRVLFKNADTGASDVCFDPSNPNILFAGLWQTRRRPWEMTSGGPGSGLYVSRDGGDSWKQLTGKGLPAGNWGKIGVAVATSNSQRVYALIETDKGGLYRSDDGGDTWSLANDGHYLRQRAWYYSTLTIDPANADVVWCPQVRMLKTIDGGTTFKMVKGMRHGDHHDIWIDPKNPRRMIDSNDGGVEITVDGGQHWHSPPLPVAQFYHISCDNQVPYHVSGTMQDMGTASGPSNSLCSTGICPSDWRTVGGGETGFTAPDPTDPNIVYAGEYGGYISRYDNRTRQARNISVYPTDPSGHGAEDLKYRFQWTAPILISPHDPKTVYHASNVLFKTNDGGTRWSPISPDLTRNDKSKQKWSGGPITGDNTGVEYYDTIFAIAESPKQKDLIWAGTDDGLVQISRDGGSNWTNVSANIQGAPEWATVTCIEPSRFEPGTAYVTFDAHRLDNNHPYLFKTDDFGATWKSLAASRPADVYLHVVREDPERKGILYLGTERGVDFSVDDGATWKPLKLNLPTVAVHDLCVKNNDLVVGTLGRSIWILDDLTPIREMTPQIAASAVHLFQPQPSYRYRMHGAYQTKGTGKNPPTGVAFNYYLKSKPKGEITLEIHDPQGGLVEKLTSTPEKPEIKDDDPDAPEDIPKKTTLTTIAGVNRVVWNLRYKGAEKIKGAKIDAGEPSIGPMALPGSYTAALTVEGKTLTVPVTIAADPRVGVPESDLKEQVQLALSLRDQLTHLTRLVHQLRSVQSQIAARNDLLKANPKAQAMIKLGQELSTKLSALEAKMHNPKAQVAYDILAQRGGAKLYSVMGALYDWLTDSDGLPTQGDRDIYADCGRELGQYETELNGLLNSDLAKINEMARALEVPNVISNPPAK